MAPSQVDTIPGGTPTVLLVEDNADHAELFQRAFAQHQTPLQLVLADSLADARACLRRSKPDLIVTDLVLSDGDGAELLDIPDTDGIPVLVVTSRGDEDAAVRTLKRGAIDYVVKPADTFADLPHMVERALREWRQQLEFRQLQQQLRDIFQLSHSLICVISSDCRFARVNPAAVHTLGWAEAELLSDGVLSLVHPEDHGHFERWLQQRFHAQGPTLTTVRMRRHDDAYVWLEWSAAPGTNGNLFAMAIDVTDRRERQQLRRAQEIAKAKLSVLTPRERQVLKRVVDGFPNKAIAADLKLNEKTVEKHRSRLMRKLKCRNLPALVKLVVAATSSESPPPA